MKKYHEEHKLDMKKYRKEHFKKYIKENPWMASYKAAKTRCNNSKATGYKNYGGRGIKCLITAEELKQLWLRDKAYEMEHPSIDRINNDGNYTYDNCQFIELSDNVKKMQKDRKRKVKK